VDVPRITPGQDIAVNVTLTIDHGGQAWLMLSCDDSVHEDGNWTILERSTNDREAHFMPSSPGAFAWAPLEYQKSFGNKMFTSWKVPEDFSCPRGHGVGRWIWKTAVSCNDYNNVGRKTEKFDPKEYAKVVHAFKPGWVDSACGSPPETFISCMDFLIGDQPPPPPPPPPTPPSQCTGDAWQQCGAPGHPSCCKGSCTCAGQGTYKQCTPASGQWKCGDTPPPTSPTPAPAQVPPPPPGPPTPPTPTPAEVVGYWSRTWTPTDAPHGANIGVAFSGWNSPLTARNESDPIRSTLVGAKWIDAGGGNANGKWSAEWLSAWETAATSGDLKDWEGIVFDVEECSNGGLEKNFADAFRAAKAASLGVLVTTSHSAPYNCADSNPLMQSFFTSSDVDYISPQLYTSGGESAPDFDAGNGVKWSDWVGAKARFVPSLTCSTLKNGGYEKVQAYFSNINITSSGYIMWPSNGCTLR